MADTLAEIGSPTNPVLVSLGEYGGSRFLDIRRYYREKTTRELRPTKKGIALNSRTLSELRQVLAGSENAIQDWLHNASSADIVRNQMQSRSAAIQRSARMAHRFVLKRASWSGPQFFAVHSEGDIDVVELNEKHSAANKIDPDLSRGASSVSSSILGALLVAYFRAKSRFDDTEEVRPNQLFDALEYEWGLILENYIQAAD